MGFLFLQALPSPRCLTKRRRSLSLHRRPEDVREWCAARQKGEFIEVFLLPVAGLYEALLVRHAGMPRPETPSQSPRESLGSDPRGSLAALR